MKKHIALTVSVAALLTALPLANAQAAGTDNTNGFVVGQFLIEPSVTVSESYNDNIYTEDSNEQSDWITSITPELRAKLLNQPVDLEFTGGLLQTLFADESDNNYLNWNVGGKMRYRIDPTLQWDASADIRQLHSLPGDDDANPTADAGEPIPYLLSRVNTSVRKDFGMIELTPRLGMTRYDFESVRRVSGALLDQNFRDRKEFVAGGRIAVDVAEGSEVFTDLEYAPRKYDIGSALDRDSDGGSYQVGYRYAPNRDLLIEVSGGFMNRDYESDAYEDIDTFDAGARVRYNIMEGTQLNFTYARSIIEVTDALTGGAIYDNFRLGLTHDFTEQLSGKIEARYANADYEGGNGATGGTSDRDDDYYGANLGMKYALNEDVAFTADYTYGNNESNRNSSEYTQNVVMVGVKIGF